MSDGQSAEPSVEHAVESQPHRSEEGVTARVVRRLARGAASAGDHCYRIRNRGRPRLLVYTDSRGFNVIGRLGRTPFGTYVAPLRSRYDLTYRISPEHPTTIVDFLNHLDVVAASDYDAIVMHCGVVDFSPRPLSSIARLRSAKAGSPRFTKLFRANEEHYRRPFQCRYRGEPTVTIYSQEFLLTDVLPGLEALPNLVWVNSNRFVPGWDGNYTKGRPGNIDAVVDDFDRVMMRDLRRVVDLKRWSPAEVQAYTIDNIHFTPAGFATVSRLIDQAVQDVVSSR